MAGRPYLRTFWRTAVKGRCPSCARTSMFSGYLDMHRQCANCGLRYETSPGAWIGALALGYGIGALVVVILGPIVLQLPLILS